MFTLLRYPNHSSLFPFIIHSQVFIILLPVLKTQLFFPTLLDVSYMKKFQYACLYIFLKISTTNSIYLHKHNYRGFNHKKW